MEPALLSPLLLGQNGGREWWDRWGWGVRVLFLGPRSGQADHPRGVRLAFDRPFSGQVEGTWVYDPVVLLMEIRRSIPCFNGDGNPLLVAPAALSIDQIGLWCKNASLVRGSMNVPSLCGSLVKVYRST